MTACSTTIPGVFVLEPMLSTTQLNTLMGLKKLKNHHDDSGHHIGHGKTLNLPWVAEALWPRVSTLEIGDMTPRGVDPMMKIYKLEKGAGVVHPHQDEDFDGPDSTRALFSIIIYLNEEYAGGETVFNRTTPAPHAKAGGGILFKHDMLHEGLAVKDGVKYVLKTDLFVK